MSAVPGWDSVNTFPASGFNPVDYEQGPRFITTGAESDSLLIRQVGDYKVYLIENGEKRHITYPDVMDLKGYSFDDVIEVSSEISNMFQVGEPIGIEVDLYFNKLTGLVESPHESQFTIGDTIKFITETTAGEDYTVETYVRLTYPDGITKKYAYHEKSDLSDPLKFSETERAFYPGTWNTQTKTWNWNEYIFAGDETEGIYIWEFWYKDTASGKILGKDVQGYEFSITPPDPIDITPPKIILLPVLGTTTDGITYYNSNVYISGTAFDPSGIKTLTVNGQGLWSIPVYGVKVFGSFINLNDGINEITISAIDNSENSNEKIEKININYYPYNVKINSPKDGSIFKEGDSIKLEGIVTGGTPQFDYEWLINGIVENSGTSDNGLIDYTLNGLALGEYNVKLRVTDFEGYVFETNEIEIFIKEPKPDLIVTDISFSKEYPAEGEPIEVTAKIKNIGPVHVDGSFCVIFNQSSHYTDFEQTDKIFKDFTSINGSDAIINTSKITGLASGEEVETKITWNVGPVYNPTYPGMARIRVSVDSLQKKINEIDEDNNEKFGEVTITSRANFLPEIDAYHFGNYPMTKEDMNKMISEIIGWGVNYPIIISTEDLDTALTIFLARGNCFGMSSSTILYYENSVEKPVEDDTFNLLISNDDVRDNIYYYHKMQWPYLLPKILRIVLDIIIWETDVKFEYNLIESNINDNNPVISNLVFYNETGDFKYFHSVTSFNTFSVSDKIKNVLVYDSNHPGMGRVIQFDFENNKINYIDVDKNGNFLHADYVSTQRPIYEIENLIKVLEDNIWDFIDSLIKSLYDIKSKLFIFNCPIDISIIDQYGRIIDNKGKNEIPDAKVKISGNSKMFLLPADLDYTINIDAFDSGDFTFTQINPLTSEYASVVSFVEVPITENTEAISEVSSTNPEYKIKIDYDGDGIIDEIIKPDIIDIVGANFYNITFLPPITTMDQFNLTDGSTLPIKFTVRDRITNEFIYDDTVNVTITNSTGHLITYFTNGTGTDSVRINSTEEQYIANFRTKDYAINVGETYTVTVTFGEVDSLRGYEITYFTLMEGGKAKGKG